VLHVTNISPLICFMHSYHQAPMTAISRLTERVPIVCFLAILSFLICITCRVISAIHHYVTRKLSSDTLLLIKYTRRNRLLANSRPVVNVPSSLFPCQVLVLPSHLRLELCKGPSPHQNSCSPHRHRLIHLDLVAADKILPKARFV
jgi:hypothetical protein